MLNNAQILGKEISSIPIYSEEFTIKRKKRLKGKIYIILDNPISV